MGPVKTLKLSGGVYLFDASSGRELKSLDLKMRVFARAASEPIRTVLNDGRVRDSAAKTFEFVMMDLLDETLRWSVTVDGLPGPMACSPDGTLVAVSRHDLSQGQDRILILDAATGRQLAAIDEVDSLAWAGNGKNMAFSNDGRRLAACFRNSTVLVWNLADVGVRAMGMDPGSREAQDEARQ